MVLGRNWQHGCLLFWPRGVWEGSQWPGVMLSDNEVLIMRECSSVDADADADGRGIRQHMKTAKDHSEQLLNHAVSSSQPGEGQEEARILVESGDIEVWMFRMQACPEYQPPAGSSRRRRACPSPGLGIYVT